MSFKVVCTSVTFGKINKEPYDRLIEAGCEVVTNNLGRPFTVSELIEVSKDADAVIVGTDKVTKEVIEGLDNVKILAKHGVGFDSIDLETAKEKGIFVTNVPGSNSQEVADLTFGFMLALSRNICKGNIETKEGKWIKHSGLSLYNKTIGVLGTGNIGECTIRRAKGFDMNILAYDKFENEEVIKMGAKYVDKETIFREADYISLHLPNQPDTYHIVDQDAFNMMKKDVILINTARTELVDFDALEKALKEGKIRGYGTDVFTEEPTPYLPIFDYDNVLISPHIGATTVDANLRMGNGAVDCVLAVKEGHRPPEKSIRNGM